MNGPGPGAGVEPTPGVTERFLADWPGQAREAVVAAARRRQYPPGAQILRQGDDATSLHLVEQGQVTVHLATPQGDSVILAVLGPGEILGEVGLLVEAGERTASATAVGDVVAWALRVQELDRLRRQHAELNDVLLRVMARRVDRLSRTVTEMLYVPAHRRVARRLHDMAQTFAPAAGGQTGPVVIPLTQQEIAQLAGTTRPTVNEALKRLERRGLIRVLRGRVELLDLAGLHDRGRW